jgi:hypothetical protein
MRGRDVKEAAEKSTGEPVAAMDDAFDCCAETAEEQKPNPGMIFGSPKRSGSCVADENKMMRVQ